MTPSRRSGSERPARTRAAASLSAAECGAGDPGTATPFAVTIGWGERVLDLGVSAESLPPECELALTRAAHHDHVPVAVDLGPGAAIAVAGEHAGAVARSLVVQLATWCGPADWRLVVVADDPAAWAWAEWLPHACVGGALWVLAADGAGDLDDALTRLADTWTGHLVVVTDRPDLMATRNSPLRRFLDAVTSVATLTVVGGVEAVPAACASVLAVGSLCTGRWCPDVGAGTDTSAVGAAGITATTADTAARRLAALHDPEDAAAGGDVPTSVTLAQVLAAAPGALDDAIGLAAHWTRADRDGHPIARLGVGDDGVVAIDLVRDGPHALVAGTTGSGKSELLRTMVASIAADAGPDDVTFVLIDYKGGATFDACRDLPHTVGVVTDLDERLAARAIRSLDAEIRRRERALRDAGAVDLADYRRAARRDGRAPLPRLVVVIDEFAALAVELPTFLSSLVGVAQRGRSLGIHLVLATQRPAGVVSDDIRANTNIRIALRLNDRHDAIDVVGSAAPAALPRSLPGRAVLRLGPEELVTFQAATSSVTVGRAAGLALVGSAAAERERWASVTQRPASSSRSHGPPARRPRCARCPHRRDRGSSRCHRGSPAPNRSSPPTSTAVDDRSESSTIRTTNAAGRWSGVTTPAPCSSSGPPARAPPARWRRWSSPRHRRRRRSTWSTLAGTRRWRSLGALPACAGVVGLHDAERRGRVVRRLTDELARRRSGRGGGPLLLAVDGLPSLLSALATHDDAAERDAWVRLIAEGAAVGIRCVATADRPGALSPSVLASFAERWVLHLDDAADAATVGLRPAVVPAALPGRAVVASSGLEAQLAVLDPGSTNGASTVDAVEPIGTLATLVHPAALSVSCRVDGACELSVGIDFLTLGAASLTVPDGEHVVVLGPARSGRSTALVRIAAAWREVHPSGWVVAVAGRTGGPLPAWATTQAGAVVVSTVAEVVAVLDRSAADAHGLIVVDDAERVDDHADALATLIARRDPHVLVACAGRPDSLRTMYGHWTAVVRRSRLGLLLALGTDADGDLLGEVLPRRTPISRPSRPGLAGRRRRPPARPGRRRPAGGFRLTSARDSGARNRADAAR